MRIIGALIIGIFTFGNAAATQSSNQNNCDSTCINPRAADFEKLAAPTPITVTPINGICGSSNGNSLSSEPTGNYCSSGVFSGLSGSGPWTWSCKGSDGGSTASCSAYKKPPATVCTTTRVCDLRDFLYEQIDPITRLGIPIAGTWGTGACIQEKVTTYCDGVLQSTKTCLPGGNADWSCF